MATVKTEIFVLDTHPLIWYLAGTKSRLGLGAQNVMQRIEQGKAVGFVPVIALAELAYIAEKGRIQLSLREVLEAIDRADNFQIVPLVREHLEELPHLTAVAEMHDRLIVATARVSHAHLITKDQAIRTSNLVPTIWD